MMKTFKDNKDRSWDLEVNVASIKRVRDIAEVDLLDIEDSNVFRTLLNDPITLCNVIYVLIKPVADERSITDEDFGRSMAGDAIEHATTALLEELTDFFPHPSRRAALKKVLRKIDTFRDLVIAHVDREMDEMDMEAEMKKAIESTLGESSGSSPESSASTPDSSPSEN